MTETSLLIDQLSKALTLLKNERELLKSLDLNGMAEVSKEKEALFNRIGGLSSTSEKVKDLATEVKHENRRNAYLVWTTLRWLKESMSFIGNQASGNKYKKNGRKSDNINGGLMLEGKI